MQIRIKRLMSALILTLTLAFASVPLAQPVSADDSNVVTIIHTNDMHGRLNESVEGVTRLARLKSYVTNNSVDLILDAGDAIQGMPISNINKGLKMLEAMADIGYDAMTIGNHEFDFGIDSLETLRDSNLVPMVSNNVVKDGNLMFDRTRVLEVTKGTDTVHVGLVGTTTPETYTKTHPNNIAGVDFEAPMGAVLEDIETLKTENADLAFIVVLAHLGTDAETPLEWRGDKLAERIAAEDVGIPVVVIDGHSHTIEDEVYGENVVYVQTGQYIDRIGRVDVDLTDFSATVTSLIAIGNVTLAIGDETILIAEEAAKTEFEEMGAEVIIDNLPVHLSSDRDIVRRKEAPLGNLITDAMMDYGKTLDQQPHLAVINGGGIRADLLEGEVTLGDIIAVLPFGNMYSSIEVTGAQILEMFEFSYDTNTETDSDGNVVLGQAGKFLHISGARVVYNALREPGDRIESIEIEYDDGFRPLDLDATYVLATNDFMAAGGDGYEMLGGSRIEGESLETVFSNYLRNNLDTINWDQYAPEVANTRVLQIAVEPELMDALDLAIEDAIAALDDRDDYTEASVLALENAVEAAEAYLYGAVSDYTESDHTAHISALRAAIDGLELVDEETPVDPVDPVDPDDPTVPEGELPATGHVGMFMPGMSMIGLGALLTAISKRKEQ